MNFRVFIERDEDGCYVATVPALSGCVSQEKTEIEANRNIKEVIELHLKCFAEDGIPCTKTTTTHHASTQGSVFNSKKPL